MTKIKELFFKYKELIVYFIYGVLATVVNFFAFWCFTKLFGEDAYLLNNALSWVVSVIFAFVSNKIFVFESKSWAFKTAGKEFIEFVGARLFSFGVEEGGMWLFIDLLGLGDNGITFFNISISGQIIVKIILSVIVVIINYVFSKFIIFKNKNKNN